MNNLNGIIKIIVLLIILNGAYSNSTFAGAVDTIYYLCDGGDRLYKFDRISTTYSYVGSTAAGPAIEAIAYNAFDDNIYGADGGTFVHINKSDGTVTDIADIDGGVALEGEDGSHMASDVDGLTFDTWGGFYWAASRRSGNFDILFKIDAGTGQVIRDAFGDGVDYILIDGTGVNLDIDDIAIDPVSGLMYAVTTVSGSSRLIEVNHYTGEVVSTVELDQVDVEGMDFSSDGTLYAAVGTIERFWEILFDGTMINEVDISDAGSCSDVESVAATTAPADTIGGIVWNDADLNGNYLLSESGIANVTVQLFYDKNGNGIIDGEDFHIQSTSTDANGNYGFKFAADANLLIRIDQSSLPAGYGMTTDNIESASFTDIANTEQDYNNNFGAATGPDCDGDGFPDFVEGTSDSDGDGIGDNCDLDSDNDGILDAVEGLVDTDGDGIVNMLDRDSDNDGIPDAFEANNGIAPAGYNVATGNIVGADADGDGLLDSVDALPAVTYGASTSNLANPDHDGDGIKDYLDLDSDNDGIADIIEAGAADTDNDGTIDAFTDANLDGYADVLISNPLPIFNSDANGNPDYIDLDSDGDGLDDTLEGFSTEGYQTPVVILDNDGDGIIDFWDNTLGGNPVNPIDTDGDGIPDYRDLDSDNDTILDLIEGNDSDANGVADFSPAGLDADGDGLDDAFDNDCIGGAGGYSVNTSDYGEEDSSNGSMDLGSSDLELTYDGVQQEAGVLFSGVAIPNGATINSAYVQFQADETRGGTITIVINGELSPNAQVFSSSNFNISSRTKTANSVSWSPVDWTINDNGVDQQTPDLASIIQEIVNQATWTEDNDLALIFTGSGTNRRTAETNPVLYIDFDSTAPGIWGCATNAPYQDFDSDGAPDWRDIDDDGDGFLTLAENADQNTNSIPDYLETGGDVDGDGIADAFDIDNDNDGIIDADETGVTPFHPTGDEDLDGIPNYLDTNDPAFANADNNTDGIVDAFDRDRDGIPDWLDLDSDNDGIPDIIEAGGTDLNNDGAVDYVTIGDPSTMADVDNDGLADAYDPDQNSSIPNLDTDGDGYNDYIDLDSDNDGIADLVEVGGIDTDGNGMADGMINPNTGDTNANGWDDAIESAVLVSNSLSDPVIDFEGDTHPNHLDLDSDNDGITDVLEAGGLDGNNDGFADNGSGTIIDVNGDGWDDAHDNGKISTTPDGGDNNTIPDYLTGTANPDFDGDGLPNWLDIDADNDGIVDNTEGQITGSYLAPTTDTDNDGLSDIYELAGTIGFFGGQGIIPENTDGTDGDDYLDMNSDNDPETDLIEGHDTNGDGIVNGSDVPNANTGLATGLDIDQDGLDDGFDNNTASLDPTNTGLNPASHPIFDAGVNRDWRASIPDAVNDHISVDEDASISGIAITSNDDWGINGPGTGPIDQVTSTTNGTLIFNNGGTPNDPTDDTFDYTPNADFNGTDQFRYAICNSIGICDTATVYITVDPINDLPDAINDGLTINEDDINVLIDVLINDDFGGDGPQMDSIHLISGPSNGTLVQNDGGTPLDSSDDSFTYTPDPDYNGTDSFDYSICDANGDCDTTTVTITIDPVPDPPIANNNSTHNPAPVNVSNPTTVPTIGGNDTDSDGTIDLATIDLDPATSGIQSSVTNTDGTYVVDASGNVTFTPAVSLTTDPTPITYVVNDNEGNTSNSATITVTYEGVAPVANDDEALDQSPGSVTLNLLTNDLAEDGLAPDPTEVTVDLDVSTAGIQTTLTISGEGDWTYNTTTGEVTFAPEAGFTGDPTDITYEVTETATGLLDQATVNIEYANTTDATNDYTNTPFNSPVVSNVLTNDKDREGNTQLVANLEIDTDGDGLPDAIRTIGLATTVAGVNEDGSPNLNAGTLTQNADGSYSYIPTTGFTGTLTYGYRVCDNGSPQECKDAMVTVEVMPESNTSITNVTASPDAFATEGGVALTSNIITNDVDPEGGTATVTSANIDTNGDGLPDSALSIGVATTVAGVDNNNNAITNAGTLTINADGTFTFIPEVGFTGRVTTEYGITDSEGNTDTAPIFIDVITDSGNQIFATDDSALTDRETPVSDNLIDNDKDPEGNAFAVTSLFVDSDGDGLTDADQSANIDAAGITVGGLDINGNPVANAGTLLIATDGSYTFTPASGFAGNVNVCYTICDVVAPAACDLATLEISVLDVQRDYGDGPAAYPIAWHRAMTDSNSDDILDGSNDVWLGTSTSFEGSQVPSAGANGDDFDDGMTFGSNPGDFPINVAPGTMYDVDIAINSSVLNTVYYGLWIDWDNDGTYDDFYNGSETTAGPAIGTVTVTTPGDYLGSSVNIRLRVDDEPLLNADFSGGKTNGEVEDFQPVVALPVELSQFTGSTDGCNTILIWTAETEENFSHYELERSDDGVNYQAISRIDGSGGLETTQTYQYFDEHAFPENYYRLKMVDLDGSIEYSKVVYLKTDCDNDYDMAIYPNPIGIYQGPLNVKFYSEQRETVVVIVDVAGRVVRRLSLSVDPSWNMVRMDLSGLSVGTYFVKQEGSKEGARFVIQE